MAHQPTAPPERDTTSTRSPKDLARVAVSGWLGTAMERSR
jgi:hypothetical protein